jgi:hypothetical protein
MNFMPGLEPSSASEHIVWIEIFATIGSHCKSHAFFVPSKVNTTHSPHSLAYPRRFATAPSILFEVAKHHPDTDVQKACLKSLCQLSWERKFMSLLFAASQDNLRHQLLPQSFSATLSNTLIIFSTTQIGKFAVGTPSYYLT